MEVGLLARYLIGYHQNKTGILQRTCDQLFSVLKPPGRSALSYISVLPRVRWNPCASSKYAAIIFRIV
ncbi:hypothetical protein KCP69_15720 [Salmonella enterica subsp. enterica]|nr:hypothetical protein KCP69_15720 [Salmonella enterica subsp. enterica]